VTDDPDTGWRILVRTWTAGEVDEDILAKMRLWLLREIECPGCRDQVPEVSDGDLLAFVEKDYRGGVRGFLAALAAGNGELP
jgi:hypothetical protein